MIIDFYLKSGQILTAHNVKNITYKSSISGQIVSYELEWDTDYKIPSVFKIDLNEVVAITERQSLKPLSKKEKENAK